MNPIITLADVATQKACIIHNFLGFTEAVYVYVYVCVSVICTCYLLSDVSCHGFVEGPIIPTNCPPPGSSYTRNAVLHNATIFVMHVHALL